MGLNFHKVMLFYKWLYMKFETSAINFNADACTWARTRGNWKLVFAFGNFFQVICLFCFNTIDWGENLWSSLDIIYMAQCKVNSPEHQKNGEFFFETPPINCTNMFFFLIFFLHTPIDLWVEAQQIWFSGSRCYLGCAPYAQSWVFFQKCSKYSFFVALLLSW